MKKTVAAALIACGAGMSGIGITYYAYRKAFYSSPARKQDIYRRPKSIQCEEEYKTMYALISEMDRLPYEQIFIKARDGIRLAARYYHLCDNAPLHIQFHGYRGSALRDFCGGNKLAREMGHNTLLVDQRAHGKSEGTTISFGIKERYDCLSWIEYARQRFGSDIPIVLSGISMGGATVLMAAELDLPENVVCIVADSPYSSPEAIIRKVIRDLSLNPKIIYPFIRLGAGVFGRFKLIESSPVDAVKKSRVPVMLIHGEKDNFVPCGMSEDILNSSPERIVRETFPAAGHGISYIADTPRYRQVTKQFIRNCLTDYENRNKKKSRP